MSFEYGSKEFKIPNPFTFQGKLVLSNGIIFAILGIILFFVISSRSAAIIAGNPADKGILIAFFAAAILLTTVGVSFIAKGLLMINKFYVGRGIPADLAHEVTKTENDYRRNPQSIFYEVHELEKALMGRTNPSFLEPVGVLERLLHSINPKLLYLPLQLRMPMQAAFECAVYLIGIFLLFVLSVLSGVVGISNFTATPLWKYIGWFYVLEMIYVCGSRRIGKRYLTSYVSHRSLKKELAWMIGFAILIPLVALFKSDVSDLAASPLPWLIGFTLLSIASFAFIYFLSLKRIPVEQPATEVSEFREQWEETVNPLEIFRNVDMTLANYRYMEIPNRKYRDFDTGLISHSKGEFSGLMTQETQPVPAESETITAFGIDLKKAGAVAGQTLIAFSGVWLFLAVILSDVKSITFFGTVSTLVGILMVTYFGIIQRNIANFYFAEIRFRSHLIHFFADGTFNKSKVSTGMSVYDSTRSENEVVQTSIRPWIVCSEIESTTFAVSGTYNLEQYRMILSLNKDDKWLDEITSALRSFLKNRKKMATAVSEADLQSTSQIAMINKQVNAIRDLNTQPAIDGKLTPELLGNTARESGGDSGDDGSQEN